MKIHVFIANLFKQKRNKLKIFFYFLILCFLKPSSYAEIKKIDSSGNYTSFPGITVLSHIKKNELIIWNKLYSKLKESKIINEYYSLLPVDSYHMTLINLYTKAYTSKNIEDDWKRFITNKNKMFINLDNYLSENAFIPKIPSVNMLLPKISNNTIAIEVPIASEQKEKVNEIANHFKLFKKVPSPFHITLAYSYKVIPAETYQEIEIEFNRIVNSNLLIYNTPLNFENPKIYYFHDMTNFKLWNKKIKEIK